MAVTQAVRNPRSLEMSDTQQSNDSRPVLITTQHRGVFAGLIPMDQDVNDRSMPLKSARMFIYWGTTRGLMELCETGPTAKSKVSAPADIAVLHDITAVFDMTSAAWQKTQETSG